MMWNILYKFYVNVSCKKKAANENSSVRRTKQSRLMLSSNCAIRGKEKSRFIKNKEACRLELHQLVFKNLNNF